MFIKCAKEFNHLGKIASKMVNRNGKANSLLRDATLSIGRASDPEYGIPASAVSSPLYVGDSGLLGKQITTPELNAMFSKDPRSINITPHYNAKSGKYDMLFAKSGVKSFVGDSGELISMQTISPWNASYFPEIFKESANCKFNNCSHTHEPGCAVLQAIEEGKISESRYASYMDMLEEQNEGRYRS
jgi:hypothetical protein